MEKQKYFLREINEYNTDGKYMNFHRYCVENWDVNMVDKMPQTNIKDFFTDESGDHLYFPTIGNYLLELFSIHIDIEQNNNISSYRSRHTLSDKCLFYKDCDASYFKSTFIEICDKIIKIIDTDHGIFNKFQFKTCHLTGNDKENSKSRQFLYTLPKWRSSLSHGMVISGLVRCYALTNNSKYLDYAKKLAYEYDILVEYGGFKRIILGNFVFYEEYPTLKKGNFVLNGFIFSLVGLYDLLQYVDDELIKKYYNDGIYTLEQIISLYDCGNGSYYDLAHLTGVLPVKTRAQYHCTHIEQLKVMYLITNKEIFLNIHNRWKKYLTGFECPVN